MKPDYTALSKYLAAHPDYVFEKNVRDRSEFNLDFTTMTGKELDEWQSWLSSKGYEAVTYVDEKSRLLDSVWVNVKHVEAIERLRQIESEFTSLRLGHRLSARYVGQLAEECSQILATLNSMIPRLKEAA